MGIVFHAIATNLFVSLRHDEAFNTFDAIFCRGIACARFLCLLFLLTSTASLTEVWCQGIGGTALGKKLVNELNNGCFSLLLILCFAMLGEVIRYNLIPQLRV